MTIYRQKPEYSNNRSIFNVTDMKRRHKVWLNDTIAMLKNVEHN